jgi:predicted Zn finger-like uncharacterized protein
VKSNQARCPTCGQLLDVTAAQRKQAAGKVRCGSCLTLFNANSGEQDFEAPRVSTRDNPEPLSGITVAAMNSADLPAAARRSPWPWLLLLLILAGALGGQLRLDLLSEPAGDRPLKLNQLLIRPHQTLQGILRLDAILQNESDEAQPLPLLQLRFSNTHGEATSARNFRPGEYLRGELQGQSQIPPRTQMQFSLELQDPGSQAMNYTARLLRAQD